MLNKINELIAKYEESKFFEEFEDEKKYLEELKTLTKDYNGSLESLSIEVKVVTPVVNYYEGCVTEWRVENPKYILDDLKMYSNEINNYIRSLLNLNEKYNVGFSCGYIQFIGTPETGITGILAEQGLTNRNSKKIIQIDFHTGDFWCYADSSNDDAINVDGNIYNK